MITTLMRVRALLACTAIGLAGCQNFSATYDKTKVSIDGPAVLLAPLDPATVPSVATINAFGALYTGEELAEYQRNSLVGGYLAQSDKLCSEYMQHLMRFQRGYSLLLGSLGTVLGSAGAAFTSASVVRPLSALAGAASGERAEFDADTFAKQTAQVIIQAIRNSRTRAYNNIVQTNFPKKIADWPPNLALADVQDYHSLCSLNEGISEAAASVNTVSQQSTSDDTLSKSKAAPPGRFAGPPAPHLATPTPTKTKDADAKAD